MTQPTYDGSPLGRARNVIASSIANFALNHIATPWYRAMIGGSIKLALEAAMKPKEEA